jgi:hypothetical protein
LEHEIRRKSLQVPFDLLVEPLGGGPIKPGQVRVQHDPLPANKQDARFDLVQENDFGFIVLAHLPDST